MPEAAHAVDPWRERNCQSKPSSGVPAHITVVFPFAPALELDRPAIESLSEIFGAIPAFEFELRTLARFPATLYLAPEPASAFVRLTEAVVQRSLPIRAVAREALLLEEAERWQVRSRLPFGEPD